MVRKAISFILTGFLILFIFAGSYHSFCECYSQTCPFHAHGKAQSNLWVLRTCSIDIKQPLTISYLALFETDVAFSTGFRIPLKPRAPPFDAFLQRSLHHGIRVI